MTSEFTIKVSSVAPLPLAFRRTFDNFGEPQVFDDPSEKNIEFSPVQLWQIGEDNKIEYTVPHGYEEAESDWIGVYKVMLQCQICLRLTILLFIVLPFLTHDMFCIAGRLCQSWRISGLRVHDAKPGTQRRLSNR